jgi:hypothetical protein
MNSTPTAPASTTTTTAPTPDQRRAWYDPVTSSVVLRVAMLCS